MFKITSGRGFHITFPNGVTLSTQFGWGNYCDNYDLNYNKLDDLVNKNNWESKNCEIAIWNKNGEWITNKLLNYDNDVKGYVEIDEWLEIFDKCRKYKE